MDSHKAQPKFPSITDFFAYRYAGTLALIWLVAANPTLHRHKQVKGQLSSRQAVSCQSSSPVHTMPRSIRNNALLESAGKQTW